MGEKSAENDGPGYGRTDFAATMITDGAIAGGAIVLSSVAATVAASSAAGSVVPGLGTIAGAGVGLIVGGLMATDAGRRVRNWTKNKVKAGLDWVGKTANKTWDKAKDIGSSIGELFSW
ncbi:YtxH domain-containing protein [Virgibacillus sp. L01]|uniref:YtxH domain-containing protein n=1 Tax=Virgibacillus sp. L01 TaxID=3457429 RepID=UPI003FCF74E9